MGARSIPVSSRPVLTLVTSDSVSPKPSTKARPGRPRPAPIEDGEWEEGWSLANLRVEGKLRWWLCRAGEPFVAFDTKLDAQMVVTELQLVEVLRETVDHLESVLEDRLESVGKPCPVTRKSPTARPRAEDVRLSEASLARVGVFLVCPSLPALECNRCHANWNPKLVGGLLQPGWWVCTEGCNRAP